MTQKTKDICTDIDGDVMHLRLLSVAQVAAMLSTSKRTIWRWASTVVDFPRPVKLAEGTVRWRLAEIQAWVDRRAGEKKMGPG